MDGIIVINKPKGMTAFDVIAKLRKKYKQSKFGHTGTLDPQAEGVLVVTAGKATKILQFMENTDKTYIGQIQLGYSTDTQDIYGNETAEKEVNLNFDFEKELQKFEGKIIQKIPMTSAKKVNGKKLMDYQRQNIPVEDQFKEVEVYSIEALNNEDLTFKVHCSSGTFIRSICQDLALNTNNEGCMKDLKRIQAGSFTIDQAQDLDIEQHILYPIEQALSYMERIDYQPIQDIYNGKHVPIKTLSNQVAVYDKDKIIAVYERDHQDIFKCKRGLW